MVREAVEEGSGEALAAEDVGPLFEREVGGDDDAGAFVGPADDLEEEFGGRLGARDVAEFIEDEEVEPFELLVEAFEDLRQSGAVMGSAPHTFDAIKQDLLQRLRLNPKEVVTEILDVLLTTDMELLLRNKLELDWVLARHDAELRNDVPLVPNSAIPLIKRLEGQQRALLELLELRGHVLHTIELSRGKEGTDGPTTN